MKYMQTVMNIILSKNIFGYVIVDRELNVIRLSDDVERYLGIIPKEGDDILDYIPELVGNEEEIKEIFVKGVSSYSLETAYMNDYYVNITIEFYDQNTAIILFENTTDSVRINQKVLQYTNESILLSNALKKVSKEQNKLISHQAKLADMGEMINNIAHQWRQPLNRINSNIAIIRTIVNSNTIDIKMIKSKIQNIEKNTKYMSNTIEDFSNFFHPDKKRVHFTLQGAVNKVLKLIESRLDGVDVKIKSEDMLSVISFKSEYYQVLLSILNNSIDNFNIKKIKNPKIKIIIKNDKEMASLSIQDNGGGIENLDIDRVFEPYYTTKFSHAGTGLGLYISKMIIEKSIGGHLSVKNTKHGACFKIKIPREDEK